MSKSIVRVFDTRSAAEAAVRDLRAAGYTDAQVSLVGRGDGAAAAENAGEGAAVGAAAGAVGGAAVTLGLMTGLIPAIGPIVALGWLGTTLPTPPAGRRPSGWPARSPAGACRNPTRSTMKGRSTPAGTS